MPTLWEYIFSGSRKKILTRRNVDVDNLNEVKNLNRKTLSGTILEPLSFSNLGVFGGTSSHYRIIHILKNFNYNKWEYANLPPGLSQERIENLLFLWGRCCIFKYNNKFYATNFSTKENKYNYDYSPKVVKVIFDVSKLKTKQPFPKTLVVGEDCVLIYNDSGQIWTQQFLGKLWLSIDLINKIVMLESQVFKNNKFLNQKLPVDMETSDEEIDAIDNIFNESDAIAIRMNLSGEKIHLMKNSEQSILTFEDFSDTLWNNYYNTWDLLKQLHGMSSNANQNKKERQINREITNNNVISNSVNETEEKFRILGFTELNKVFNTKLSVKLKKEEQELLQNEDNDNKLKEEIKK